MQKTIQIGLIQSSCSANSEDNFEKAKKDIIEAASKGAQIICLQELFSHVYICDKIDPERLKLAELIPGASTHALSALAKDLNVVIVASFFERVTVGVYYNTAAVIDADGTYLGKYRKIHIPDDECFYEKFYFIPGDLGYKVFPTRYGKIGVLICWDQWFPEAARITALQGAEILFYPTAIGWATEQDDETNLSQFDAWKTIQRSHAIANNIHVVSVNRIGIEGTMKFWGGSFISDPFGKVLCSGSHENEEIIIQEIDLSLTEYYRNYWTFFRDRRVDTYQPIVNKYIDNEDNKPCL